MSNDYKTALWVMEILANKAAMAYSYKGWSDEFCRSEIKRFIDEAKAKPENQINPLDLTATELKSLGAMKWEDESSLMLLPLWLYHFIPDHVALVSIDGGVYVKRDGNIDLDIRFGCIAYGVHVDDEKKQS